jgi:hypothetical protein
MALKLPLIVREKGTSWASVGIYFKALRIEVSMRTRAGSC